MPSNLNRYQVTIKTDFGTQTRVILARDMFQADQFAQAKYGDKHIETNPFPI